MRLQNGTESKCSSEKGFKKADVQTVSTANSPYSEHIRSLHLLITSGRGELWFVREQEGKKPRPDTIRCSTNNENMIHFIYFSIYVIFTIGYIRN